jgi:hypothetical protein
LTVTIFKSVIKIIGRGFDQGRDLSIATGYGQTVKKLEFNSWQGHNKFFSSPQHQTSSGAHSASYPMGTVGFFPTG